MPLLDKALRASVEQRVSQHLGRKWTVETIHDRTDQASHPAAVLSDESYAVFVKRSEHRFAQDQFEREKAGLRMLSERAGVLTPTVIGILMRKDEAIMILEAVQIVKREAHHWRQIGRALAQVHKVKWDRCGLESHCYFGDLRQDNGPITDWPSFYQERRLQPRLKLAVDSGHLPVNLIPEIEKVISRLPQLCGPKIEPSLLHGDAHLNNIMSTNRGPVMIDPSVHYGHPEIDLAWLDSWLPVSEEVFAGYRETTSIDPGFIERRDLWRIAGWLGVVAVDGGSLYLDWLMSAVRKYL